MTGRGLRAGAVLLFVFAAGALVGTGLERHHVFIGPAEVSLLEENEIAVAELSAFLDLDEEQAAQINAILLDRQQLVEQMWAQFRPEVQDAMRQVHTDIAELLRPDQVERFHAWLGRHAAVRGPNH